MADSSADRLFRLSPLSHVSLQGSDTRLPSILSSLQSWTTSLLKWMRFHILTLHVNAYSYNDSINRAKELKLSEWQKKHWLPVCQSVTVQGTVCSPALLRAHQSVRSRRSGDISQVGWSKTWFHGCWIFLPSVFNYPDVTSILTIHISDKLMSLLDSILPGSRLHPFPLNLCLHSLRRLIHSASPNAEATCVSGCVSELSSGLV